MTIAVLIGFNQAVEFGTLRVSEDQASWHCAFRFILDRQSTPGTRRLARMHGACTEPSRGVS